VWIVWLSDILALSFKGDAPKVNSCVRNSAMEFDCHFMRLNALMAGTWISAFKKTNSMKL
jgi:hypothetical protein